jgi:F0F1-type ATP synthase alpha subunit
MKDLTFTLKDVENTFKKLEEYLKQEEPQPLNLTEEEMQVVAYTKVLHKQFPRDRAIQHFNKLVDKVSKKMTKNLNKVLKQIANQKREQKTNAEVVARFVNNNQ